MTILSTQYNEHRMHHELRAYIRENGHTLQYSEIMSGVVDELLGYAPNLILAVCWEGRGRTPLFSQVCERLDIPAIALQHGTFGLNQVPVESAILAEIKKFPFTHVFLDERQVSLSKIALGRLPKPQIHLDYMDVFNVANSLNK